jgi:hypothetical protein
MPKVLAAFWRLSMKATEQGEKYNIKLPASYRITGKRHFS